ncbi:regulatory protein [Hyphomonas neptunium ATCC 15444]|uniref:Regulatory protein n=2 Tax=Hyphomonas TaxID=85 RepID=Q0BZP7_HYPNA|nr:MULTISPECIES: nucleoside diphosphate kinase regulator [Hyphomonas]ABI78416.1 regulatory protein [Hyphomonas neptunium ATCC 15444]KCZ86745.1 regulatory protein [Hyphomonas hirschiana VP5]
MSQITRPPIYVTDAELERLSDLAHAVQGREPAADMLIEELSRARVTAVEDVPVDVVRMHDRVNFVYDGARYEDFTLVYPYEANIADKRISILTQVGAMLIGLQVGDAMQWAGRDGRGHSMEVLEVSRN